MEQSQMIILALIVLLLVGIYYGMKRCKKPAPCPSCPVCPTCPPEKKCPECAKCPQCAKCATCPACPACSPAPVPAPGPRPSNRWTKITGQEHAGDDIKVVRDVTADRLQQMCIEDLNCNAINWSNQNGWGTPGGGHMKTKTNINNTNFKGDFYVLERNPKN